MRAAKLVKRLGEAPEKRRERKPTTPECCRKVKGCCPCAKASAMMARRYYGKIPPIKMMTLIGRGSKRLKAVKQLRILT